MNQIIRSVLDGEVISPNETIRVVGKTRPLVSERIEREVALGLSLSEILEEVLPEVGDRHPLLVSIDDHVIPQENWRKVRPKRGTTVTFTPVVHGSQMRTVLGTVAAVAAIVIASFIVGPQVLALTGMTAALVKAAIAGGIMLASTYALNALFPIRPPDTSATVGGSVNSIQGAQNQANPFGAVPVVLGRHRQSPYFAAKPYTEIVGGDQYLRLLFCLGYGPLQIEDLKIGETPISSFTGVTVEIRQGFEDDDPITIYPGQVDEVSLQIELDAPFDPFNPNPGAWQTQTTDAETDQISIDVTAVDGIFATDPQGDEVAFVVAVHAEYRAVGSVGAWTAIPTLVFTRSLAPQRQGRIVDVSRGQYDVRTRRATGRGIPQYTKDKIVWTAIRSFRNDPPVNFPKPLALIALRIKATGQLSGTIDTFNCITTSLVNAYSGSGSAWNADTASQNPADLFRHVLQSPANERAESDARIDLDSLQAWHTYCVSKGFKFNQVITQAGSLFSKLNDIASAGRAVPLWINGKWGVSWDRPDASIVQHFTPANSWDMQGLHPYAALPHGWRVSFINERNGFTTDERIVYDDGYDTTNATLFEGIQFPGVTDPDLVWKHGRFHIAQARLRPETITLSAGWEHLICTRGDRVRVTHDVLMIGLQSGRVKSVDGQSVTLDQKVTLENGKTYAFRFRVPEDARSIDRSVVPTAAGDYDILELSGDLSLVKRSTLYAFGESDRTDAVYRVKGIAPQKDLAATITLVDDAPAISQADEGEIPEYVPNVTIPPDPYTLPPRDLRYSELIDGQGATARALVHLYWQVPRFGNIQSFEVQMQDVDNGGDWAIVGSVAPPATTIDIPITRAGVVSFRVRCIFQGGAASTWASIENVNILALSTPPTDIKNLHQRTVDGQTALDWAVLDDKRLIYYEVRKGSTWDTALVVGDAITQPPWSTTGDGIYHVRPYVLSPFGARIYSENAVSISIVDSILSRNIIVERDEQATGWNAGVGLDGGVIDGGFIRTDPSSSISQPFAEAIVEQLDLDGVKIAIFVSGQIVDVGRLAECRFWTEYDAVGVLQSADFLGTSDFLGQADVLGASPTRQIRAFPIWRFGGPEDTDVFAPADIFAESDIFTAGITWGEWVAIASGAQVARYFQPGLVLITDAVEVNATGTKFKWFVDVPDRTDDYTNLNVPDTGLAINFFPRGYDGEPPPGAVAIAFKGGPNNASVPHVQRAIVDGTTGDEVEVSDITLAGCTIHVLNDGNAVARAGVNLLVRGY